MKNIFVVLSLLLVAGCSNVSFNKNVSPESTEFNKFSMRWERTLKE